MTHVKVKDGYLHYTVQGKGTPLIFIHPPILPSINFKYQLDELSQFFTIIVFDIRGHGKSRPSKQTLTYPLIVQDIKQIMDHLNVEKAFVCGYSTGGSIALEFLLSAPERALGAIIVSGISEVNDLRLKKRVSRGALLSKMGAIYTLAFSIAWTNSDNFGFFWKLFSAAKKTDTNKAKEYYLYSLNYNCTDQLKDIPFPVLLVYGAEDKDFHAYGMLLHQNLPNNELVWIPAVKHQIPTKAHHQLNNLIKQFVLTSSTSYAKM